MGTGPPLHAAARRCGPDQDRRAAAAAPCANGCGHCASGGLVRDGVGLVPMGPLVRREGAGLSRGGAATTRAAGWEPSNLRDRAASIGEPSMVAASISCPTSGTHCDRMRRGGRGAVAPPVNLPHAACLLAAAAPGPPSQLPAWLQSCFCLPCTGARSAHALFHNQTAAYPAPVGRLIGGAHGQGRRAGRAHRQCQGPQNRNRNRNNTSPGVAHLVQVGC